MMNVWVVVDTDYGTLVEIYSSPEAAESHISMEPSDALRRSLEVQERGVLDTPIPPH